MRMGQGVRTGLGHGGITCVLQTQFSSFITSNPDVGLVAAFWGGIGCISEMLEFYIKLFYVMGKVLSGKLNPVCSQDLSCCCCCVVVLHPR